MYQLTKSPDELLKWQFPEKEQIVEQIKTSAGKENTLLPGDLAEYLKVCNDYQRLDESTHTLEWSILEKLGVIKILDDLVTTHGWDKFVSAALTFIMQNRE